MEVVASSSIDIARPKLTTFGFYAQAAQPQPSVAGDVDERIRRVARAEVVFPAAQYRVEIRDHLSNVIMAPCSWSQLLHALSYSPHAALRRPSLEKVHALAQLLPDWTAQPLPRVTAEKVEPLFAP